MGQRASKTLFKDFGNQCLLVAVSDHQGSRLMVLSWGGGPGGTDKGSYMALLYSGSSFMAVLFSFSRFLGHKVDQGLGGLQKQDNHPGQSLTTD